MMPNTRYRPIHTHAIQNELTHPSVHNPLVNIHSHEHDATALNVSILDPFLLINFT
eukprot:m.309256 g.309256  ORF g.309256 m.309256 type:complete len:56 (+) comp15945_c3_seq3:1146-1313(+)